MPLFHYQAIDNTGRNFKGVMPAADELTLEEKLKAIDLWLIDATTEVLRTTAGDKRATPRFAWLPAWNQVKRRELIEFCTLMSFETRVGIPLIQALEMASQDCSDVSFRRILEGLIQRLESGELLNEALEKYPRAFSPQFISVIRAGESSGKLTEAFTNLKEYLEWVEKLIADVRQASLYPLITLVVVMCFGLFIFTFIVPKFVELMTITKVPVPLLTKIIFGVSNFTMATWWVWVTLLLFVTAGIPIGKNLSRPFAYFMDYLKINLPLFGELNLMLSISRFAHNLAILYSSGINIIESMKLCQGLVGCVVVEDAVAQMVIDLNSGHTISEAMRKHKVFPAILLRMVTMGETTGKLDQALQNVSDYYNEVIPRRIKKIFTFLEPAITLSLIFLVGAIALGIYLPLLSLMGSIGK